MRVAPAAGGSAALVTLGALGLRAAGQPVTGPPPGNYEAYSVALEYQPVFSKGYCKTDTWRHISGSYSETHLAVHGLWPNYDPDQHGGAWYPQYCKRPAEDYTQCQGGAVPSYCRISAATLAAFNTSSEWLRYAPEYAWGTLAEHEWAKHGSCTPWTQLEYFGQISELYAQLIQGQGPSNVTATVGGSLTYNELRAAFAADSGGAAPQMECKECSLSEVRVLYKADPSSMAVDLTRPVAWKGTDSCSGCAAVAVDQWSGNCSAPSVPPPPPRPPTPPSPPELTAPSAPPSAAPAPAPSAAPSRGAPTAASAAGTPPTLPPEARGGAGPTTAPSAAAAANATVTLPSATATATESVLHTECPMHLTTACEVIMICAALLWLAGAPSPAMPYLALVSSRRCYVPGLLPMRWRMAVVLHPLQFSILGDPFAGALCGNFAIWITLLLIWGLSRWLSKLTRRASPPIVHPLGGVSRRSAGFELPSPGGLFFAAHSLLQLGTCSAGWYTLVDRPASWWIWPLSIFGVCAPLAPACAVDAYLDTQSAAVAQNMENTEGVTAVLVGEAAYVTDPQTPQWLARIIGPGEWVCSSLDAAHSRWRSYRPVLQLYGPFQLHFYLLPIGHAFVAAFLGHFPTLIPFCFVLLPSFWWGRALVRPLDKMHEFAQALVLMVAGVLLDVAPHTADVLLAAACFMQAVRVVLVTGGLLYTMGTHRRARLQAIYLEWRARSEDPSGGGGPGPPGGGPGPPGGLSSDPAQGHELQPFACSLLPPDAAYPVEPIVSAAPFELDEDAGHAPPWAWTDEEAALANLPDAPTVAELIALGVTPDMICRPVEQPKPGRLTPPRVARSPTTAGRQRRPGFAPQQPTTRSPHAAASGPPTESSGRYGGRRGGRHPAAGRGTSQALDRSGHAGGSPTMPPAARAGGRLRTERLPPGRQ